MSTTESTSPTSSTNDSSTSSCSVAPPPRPRLRAVSDSDGGTNRALRLLEADYDALADKVALLELELTALRPLAALAPMMPLIAAGMADPRALKKLAKMAGVNDG